MTGTRGGGRSRRTAAAVAVVFAAVAGGCAAPGQDAGRAATPTATPKAESPQPPPPPAVPTPSPKPSWDGQVKVIGDGSTSDTGPQPGQPPVEKLAPGQKPPQFVVFSWDGALENDDHLFSHFRQVARENNAQMTFFLSGIYLVPNAKRSLYRPPQHSQGDSAISFPTDAHLKETLHEVGEAWREGNEIGTHFNGHFCEAKGGGDWSVDEWRSEIEQAYAFVSGWKTNTGFKDLPPLPFDVRKDLAGGRAPCLEGQKNLLAAAKSYGWRYDASSPGEFQVWPTRKDGIWNFPLQLLPYPGRPVQVLSMDFNFLANQSGESTQGDPRKYPEWRKETRDGYLNGFERVYNGSRAPLFVGNHFETWNGGIYMQAVEDVVKSVCRRDGVRCVSFRQLADWLDAQDPKVLAQLRQLDPAQAPDWATFLK
ncbi:hypothetical protein ACIRPK_06335 [Kitasatospora sp. NPDC101801]|uniref:hypothetical protein n=1 Tax=Kitasatospora sp. NPDC101801 TaxID=3364103 RepID=UPI003816CE8C